MRYLSLLIFLVCSLGYGQGVIPSPYVTFPAASCLDPGEFPTGNAASCPSTDATTGWTALQFSTFTSEVVSGRDYVIQCVSTTTTASQGIQITINGFPASWTYDIYYDYSVTNAVSSTQVARAWEGFTTAPAHTFETDGVWRTRQETLVNNSTQIRLRFYSTRLAASGANTIQIDNVRVVAQWKTYYTYYYLLG